MEKKTKIILILLFIVGGVALYINKEDVPNSPSVSEQDKEPITLLFVGDIMLDRGVRNALNREGVNYAFEGVRDLLTSADLTVGNLEGTFTDKPSVSVVDNKILRFTFDLSLATMLEDFGFDGFSLANNHALDFGEFGFEETQATLSQHGLFYFGSANNDKSNISKRVTVKESEFCFVGYHQLFTASTLSVVTEITNLDATCDYTVVFAHWGEEYKDIENDAQRNIGRVFIDAGADLVIGAHPHVVQPVEIYKDKAIFYSLGNFLFDQDFSLATRQSLAVRLTLSEDEQQFHLIPIEMSRARLYYPEKESFQSRMNILISELPESHRTEADIDSTFSLPR